MRCAMATISVLSMPINGRNTGIVATISVQPIACIVWLATCPKLSPVINAPHSSFLAICSATRIIKRRMIIVNNSSGQLACINSCTFVKGTVYIFILPLYALTCVNKRTTLSSARSLVYGGLAKWMAVSSTPRFAIIQEATGLSIPPLINTAAFPPVPTGIPPAPCSARPLIYAP